jgi:hypothetical protein
MRCSDGLFIYNRSCRQLKGRLRINQTTLLYSSSSSSQFLPRFAKMVKTLPFGKIQVPVPGFGAMGLSSSMGYNLSYDEAEPVLLKAIELGCIFWDTAVCQGPSRGNYLIGLNVANA